MCSVSYFISMIKLNRQVDYAMQFIFRLSKAKNDQHISLKKFSTESNISFLFLQKIAKALRQAGLVRAELGPQGGYSLQKPIESITLKNQ